MSDDRISQMLNDQLQNQFSGADLTTQQQMMPLTQAQPVQALQGLMQGGPIHGSTMDAFNAQQAAPPPQAQPPASNLLGQTNSNQIAQFANSPMNKILGKLNINDTGMAFNALGRMQLVSRLKEKYGEQYDQNPDALDALSAFDKHVQESPIQSTKSLTAATQMGQKTLKALMGGT